MSSSAGIVESVPFHGSDVVRMAGARDVPDGLIVAGPGVPVLEYDGYRGTCGVPVMHAAEDPRLVAFGPGSGAPGPALAPEDVRHEILLAQGEACLHSVDDDADGGPVRFTEYPYLENPSECVHPA